MNKLVKVFVVLIGLVLALLLVGTVLLHICLPPEKAKKLVLDRLSAQLKREVKVDTVSVGILTGLQMTNLKISESPNFSKGKFLSSDLFSVKVSLVPLLFRKVIVRQIILKRPDVTIVRYADGKTFNFSDLLSPTASVPSPHAGDRAQHNPNSAPSPASLREGARRADEGKVTANGVPSPQPSPTGGEGESQGMPFLLLVSRAEIQNGALHFVDHSPAQQSMTISPFNVKLDNVSLTTPFGIKADMRINSKGSDLAIAFAGDVNLLEGDFQIKDASVISQESKITASGKVSGFKSAAPQVDLSIEMPQFKVANFSGFVALPPELHINGAFTGHADLSGDQKAMNFSARMDGTNTAIQYGKSFSKPEKVTLMFSAGGVVKNMAEADIQSLKAVLGALTLSGHGKIQNLTGAQPSLAFHIESNSFPIEEVLTYAPGSVPAGVTLKGNNKLSADVSGTAANAQFSAKWDGTEMAVAQADNFSKAAGLPMDVSVTGNTAGPNKILIKNLTAKLLSNVVTGAGTYETRGTQGIIAFDAKGTNWAFQELAKVSPLLSPYHPVGTLSFEAHATGSTAAPQTSIKTSADVTFADIKQTYYEGQNLHLKWNLTDVTPELTKISGTASLKQGPGKILNVEQLAQTSKVGRIALSPLAALAKIQDKGMLKQVNLPSLQSIPFDSLVGDYLLHQGTMEIKTFDLNGRDLSIDDRGTVGLAGEQPLNMNVVMKLAAGSVGGSLGAILQDENGRPTLKFAVTGSVADPHVKLDLQDTGKKAVQEIIKSPQVQNAVNNLLKGVFH